MKICIALEVLKMFEFGFMEDLWLNCFNRTWNESWLVQENNIRGLHFFFPVERYHMQKAEDKIHLEDNKNPSNVELS